MIDELVLAIVKLLVDKLIIEQGEKLDWVKLKADAQSKLDALLPPSIYDDVAKYLVGVLLDLVSAYFVQNAIDKPCEASVHQAVNAAGGKLLKEVGKAAVKAALASAI